MKIIKIMIIGIITLLCFSAGLAKVLRVPQEVEFLTAAGLTPTVIIIFGLLQITASGLLLPLKTRKIGASLATFTLLASSILLFREGTLPFALFSLLPVALAGIILYRYSGPAEQKN